MNSPQAQLAPVLAAGGPRLAQLLERTEQRLAAVAGSHGAALGAHAAGTLAAGGKRLRPVLVFLCAGGEPARDAQDSGAAPTGDRPTGDRPTGDRPTGDRPTGDAPTGDGDAPETRATLADARLLAAATAVELLHVATLVHDDVLDRAPLRRGQPTVYADGGRAAATATGDFLFSRAFAELVPTGEDEAVRALSRASSALARGELMQRADAWSATVDERRYLERCRLKTGSLFDASCRLGALLGGERQLAGGLGRFGEAVGLAFQLLDDVLDVSGPAERTGKPRGTDLLDGTVNLPLILAREGDPSLRELDLRTVDLDSAAAVCDRIVATGALEAVRARALTHVSEAKDALTRLGLGESRHHALALVADGVVERYA